MKSIRVGVLGAGGKMGVEVCRAVSSDPDTELVALIDPSFEGRFEWLKDHNPNLEASADIDSMLTAGVEVAVDFTQADAARRNIDWCVKNGIHIVVGTTGLVEEDLVRIAELVGSEGRANVLIAPNFAIGAVLMMYLAERVAAHMPDVEIIELHQPAKKDAPSGTALRTAEAIARGRAHGGSEVPIHSVRLPGLVAHQEVIFGGVGQTLSIRHDSTDRTSFMPGVLLAVKRVGSLPGLTMGLDTVLDL